MKIPKSAWYLSITSFFTDVAGEAIYPLLPVFLTATLGASALLLGFLEGLAESVASLTKFFSGYYSDRLRKREPFVIAGYGLSGFTRPLMGLVTATGHVFAVRILDRIGKGIRGAPRDAWLARLATGENRGYLFGFHRAWDHAGAVVGPLLATGFLLLWPGEYRALFLSTSVIGVVAFGFALAARKVSPPEPEPDPGAPKRTLQLRGQWAVLPAEFKRYLLILMLFTLGNSTDAFLLLKLSESGVDSAWLPTLWAAFHVFKMLSSSAGGKLSDRIGRGRSIVLGWGLYAAVYFALAWIQEPAAVIGLFLLYGLYYGLTEGPEKAWVADLVPHEQRGTAFGLYHLTIGAGTLPASILFGLVWKYAGPSYAFCLGAILSITACLLLTTVRSGFAVTRGALDPEQVRLYGGRRK